MKKALFGLLLTAGSLSGFAQETDYTKVSFTYLLGPTLLQYNNYKTFDVRVIGMTPEADKSLNLPYQLKLGKLAQVDSAADFHAVVLVQRVGGKLSGPSSALANVALTTTIYNKYGAVVKAGSVANEQLAVDFGRELSATERSNQDLVRRLILEKAIEASAKGLTDGLYGSSIQPLVRIASVDGVKKLPELKAFEEQVKVLKPALEKGGLEAFRTAAQPFLSFWETSANYSGDKAEEVKRAALHNLALYYIAAGDAEKAKTYIEPYKAIDKQIKELMGLVKYKNSEELEKLITTLAPATAAEAGVVMEGAVLSTSQVLDAHRFLIIDGTVTIHGKKIAGTYTGLIKVNKIPAGGSGGIMSLDPENIAVEIVTKDAAGQAQTINTNIAQIDELKSKTGTSYITEKFGTAVLGDGSYNAFMQSTFSSPKITVHRGLLPAGNTDYVVRKAGDAKGVKSSLFNARKNLEEYLSDCPAFAEKLKSGAIEKSASVEKLVEAYSNCQ